jgi:hypothetical protein
VNNDIRGLLDAVNAGTSGAFMWEWFTTKPFADAGECRFVGSVPTPWPSWLIAAHPARAGTAELRTFLTTLSGYVREFDSAEKREKENVKYIVDTWDYKEEDVKVRGRPVFLERCGLDADARGRRGSRRSSTPPRATRSLRK